MQKKVLRKQTLIAALICAHLVAGGYGTIAWAAEDKAENKEDFSMEQIVVTATRTPVKEFDANANITVITAEEIAKNHYQDLSEALRSVPGVYIGNYSLAGYDNSNAIKINGADEIVVIIDGVKVNSAGVKFSATMFKNMDNIERIEVLKGSASTLYGADAKGGVINIITKKVDHNQSKLSISGGSYERENYSFMHEGRQDDVSWRIFAQKDLLGDFKDGRGVTTPAALNADTKSFRITKEFGEKSDLTLMYDAYKADSNYTALWEPDLKKGEIDNYTIKMIYNTKIDHNTMNQFSIMNNMFDTDFDAYLTKIRTVRIADQFTKKMNDEHNLTAGFEFTEDKVISFDDVKLTNRALYIQDEWNFAEAWKLTGGLRYDNNSGFGSHYTPSVNLGYKFNEKANMYVGYSEYFIPPSPTNLYSAKYGNLNMKPETGDTSEIGFNYRIDETLEASTHLFKRNSTDRIGYINSLKKYGNVGAEKADGWDIQLKKHFSKSTNAYVGYTHTNVDATDQRAKNVDGYIPKGAWNVGIDYSENKVGLSLVGRGVVDRPGPETPDAVDNFFPVNTYWVWDMAFNYQANQNVKAFIKVNNLFDKFYAEHSNARYNWSSTPDEEWWSAPGRNVVFGVEYTF